MKRNQVIISALVVMIAIAGYLNIADAQKMAREETKDVATFKELPDGTLVPDEDIIASDGAAELEDLSRLISGDEEVAIDDGSFEDEVTAEKGDDPGQAIFVSTNLANSASQEFFASAKLEREQVRAKEKDILTEMMGNQNLAKDDISQCATALLDIQKRIEKEAAAEAMIEAKGFKEAYVRIDDSTVDVVVSKGALTEAEIAQIEDIVTRKTGFAPDSIKISTLKTN